MSGRHWRMVTSTPGIKFTLLPILAIMPSRRIVALRYAITAVAQPRCCIHASQVHSPLVCALPPLTFCESMTTPPPTHVLREHDHAPPPLTFCESMTTQAVEEPSLVVVACAFSSPCTGWIGIFLPPPLLLLMLPLLTSPPSDSELLELLLDDTERALLLLLLLLLLSLPERLIPPASAGTAVSDASDTTAAPAAACAAAGAGAAAAASVPAVGVCEGEGEGEGDTASSMACRTFSMSSLAYRPGSTPSSAHPPTPSATPGRISTSREVHDTVRAGC